MSSSMYVVLECGPVPDDVVPPDQQSVGQNVIKHLGPLAGLAADRGLAPLDAFIVDWCGLVEAALQEAGWREPELPEEWGGVIPIGGPPVTDPAYLAALAEYDRICEQVYQQLPWYQPAEGLATVRGLVAALDATPPLADRYYGAVWDLRAYRFKLEYAEQIVTRFHFGVGY